MGKEGNDSLNKHLEDIKKYESDLFEDPEEIEAYFLENSSQVYSKPTKSQKGGNRANTFFTKGIIFFIAVVMLISAIGTLTNVLNVPVVDFLKKSQQLSKDPVIQSYKEAIVTVKSADRKGTGFNISEEGYIVTNSHIVEDEQESVVSFQDGSVYLAEVIQSFPAKDLALLVLTDVENDKVLPYLEIEPTKKWTKDEPVYFVGNPLSFNFIANEGVIVGETEVNRLDIPALLIRAPVHSGNSGSPVINNEGKVIAMIYAKGDVTIDNEVQSVGFAIPIYTVTDLIQQYKIKIE